MTTTTKPLLALTASDLMSPDVITVPQNMTLGAAAQLLARENISGVPVVNREGRCVGILSATDFMTLWAWGGSGETAVSRHMTPDPVTVSPTTPIATLARMLIDAHIHRIIVVDRQGKPVGVVSSTDILAAVAFSANELWTPGGP
jgi:CBS domain-containing protein